VWKGLEQEKTKVDSSGWRSTGSSWGCNIRDKDHYYTFREMFPGNFLIEKMSLQSP
jgi:hypothetical protein